VSRTYSELFKSQVNDHVNSFVFSNLLNSAKDAEERITTLQGLGSKEWSATDGSTTCQGNDQRSAAVVTWKHRFTPHQAFLQCFDTDGWVWEWNSARKNYPFQVISSSAGGRKVRIAG